MTLPLYASLLPGHIRIATLHPDFFDAPLNVTVHSTSLADLPAYEGLSYHWGANDLEWQTVQVNGSAHKITIDLADALRHLRRFDESRVLWIDQICIDQANVLEKNAQIPMMRDIFARAQRVVMWLGPLDQSSELAMQSMHRIADALEAANPNGSIESDTPSYVAVAAQHLSRDGIVAITKLLQRPWWGRIWIVQEVAMAQERMIQCGFLEIDFGRLSRAHMLVLKTKRWRRLMKTTANGGSTVDSDSSRNASDRENDINNSMMSQIDAPSRDVLDWSPLQVSITNWETACRRVPLLHLVHEFRFRIGRDNRDQVFALCGLCPVDYLSNFCIDYKMCVEAVFLQLAQFHARTHNDISFLTIPQRRPRKERSPGLPSWVPDWTAPKPIRRSLMRWPFGDIADPDPIIAYESTEEADISNQSAETENKQWYAATVGTNPTLELLVSPQATSNTSPFQHLHVKGLRHSYKIQKILPPLWQGGSILTAITELRDRLELPTVNESPVPGKPSSNPFQTMFLRIFLVWLSWYGLASKISSLPNDKSSENERENVRRHDSIYLPTGENITEAFWRTTLANRTAYGGKVSAEREGAGYFAFLKNLLSKLSRRRRNVSRDRTGLHFDSLQKIYFRTLMSFTSGRRFFVTDGGWMGLAPEEAEPGDEVVLVLGLPVPLVLRQTNADDDTKAHEHHELWEVIGECYLHGIMDGEALHGLDMENEENFKDFVLE